MNGREFAGNWQNFGECGNYSCSYFKNVKYPEHWGIHYFHSSADADCISTSNKEYIERKMARFMRGKNPQVMEVYDRHWSGMYLEGIAVKVYNDKKFQGSVTYTKAFLVFRELMERLEDYPMLDEDDASRREYGLFEENLYQAVDFAICRYDSSGKKYSKKDIYKLCSQFIAEYNPDMGEDCFPEDDVYEFVKKQIGIEPKEEDMASYNGTYRKGKEFVRVRWYEGVGSYYAIFNDKPATQGSMNLGGVKKLIRDGWVKV